MIHGLAAARAYNLFHNDCSMFVLVILHRHCLQLQLRRILDSVDMFI